MNTEHPPNLRLLPKVDRVLDSPDLARLSEQHGRVTVRSWVRDVLEALRNGQASEIPAIAEAAEALVIKRVSERAARFFAERLRKVINGTGIVLHTNLGRAPLAAAAIAAIQEAAEGVNVEIDLESGLRGRRGAAVETLCQELTGAEAALVVNNCAAATLLTLQTLAGGRQVVISRGQLIEIGGSFRLPDVFRQAGVELCEVGTTNRTRLDDYAQAIGPQTAALLRVHPSNYRMSGFCESVSIHELVKLGAERSVAVVDDVGSGCLYDLSSYGLNDEPMVRDSVGAGADLVLFSGDKLLGGPQCGIIVGRADLIARLRANPLVRAIRVDKLTLAALQATLEIHRAGRAFSEIPVLAQLALSADGIRPRGERLLERLQNQSATPAAFSLEAVASASGGGALPEMKLPSWAIAISSASPADIAKQLRLGAPAVLAYVKEGRTLIDLRTVQPKDDDALLQRLLACTLERAS